jgi:transcription initiation factor TFIIB
VAGVASAAIYLACRKCEVNRSLAEVAERSYLEKKVVAKYYRQMVKEMEISSVPMASIQKHISKLFNNLNATTKMPEKVERLAISIATKASGASMSSGRSPAGLAAAFLYVSANLLNEHLPQRDVAEAAGITEVTIRKRCKELFENFNVSVKVHAA